MASRDEHRVARAAPSTSLHRGGPAPAHPARPSTRLIPGGVVKSHPKWSEHRAPGPGVRIKRSGDPVQVRSRLAANSQRASTGSKPQCRAARSLQGASGMPPGRKTKRPGTFRCPGLCNRELGGARLRAPSTRWHLILIGLRPRVGSHGVHGAQALIEFRRQVAEVVARRDAHERPARCGSNAGEAQICVHDGSCWCWMKFMRPVPRRKWTVNSLYCGVNRLDNLFLSRCCF